MVGPNADQIYGDYLGLYNQLAVMILLDTMPVSYRLERFLKASANWKRSADQRLGIRASDRRWSVVSKE
jgi:hypothetical protein